MKEDYSFSAIMYDPMLYLFLRPIRLAVLNELLEYKGKTILDLCCGTGNQLKLLSKNGFKDLHCLDISEEMLRVAKQDGHTIKIHNEDAVKTSFENASFDIIIISFAIHEKDRTTQERMLEEVHRLIRQNGHMLIVDFVFDTKTKKLGRMGIGLIELMAGGEHYINFKGYIQNNGLANLIQKDKFKLIKDRRMGFNGVTISTYQKR